jgi:hypothetical protein
MAVEHKLPLQCADSTAFKPVAACRAPSCLCESSSVGVVIDLHVFDGKIYHGRTGSAGEGGHVSIDAGPNARADHGVEEMPSRMVRTQARS